MAEAIGLAASIIGVATLAYSSSKALYELLDGIHEAPKTLEFLKTDLDALQKLLSSLEVELKHKPDKSLSDGLKHCLEEVEPSLKACSKACDEFREKVSKITSHSTEQHTSLRDKVKLQFQEKEITTFRYRLTSYKSTLNIALSFASLKTTSQSTEALQSLEATIEKTMGGISGQIQGMEIGMHAIVEFGDEKDELEQALNEQNAAMGQCLKVCMAALSGVNQKTGNAVKYARAYDDAKQMVGTIGYVTPGGATTTVEEMTAHQRAKQVGGTVNTDFALAFFKD